MVLVLLKTRVEEKKRGRGRAVRRIDMLPIDSYRKKKTKAGLCNCISQNCPC